MIIPIKILIVRLQVTPPADCIRGALRQNRQNMMYEFHWGALSGVL